MGGGGAIDGYFGKPQLLINLYKLDRRDSNRFWKKITKHKKDNLSYFTIYWPLLGYFPSITEYC